MLNRRCGSRLGTGIVGVLGLCAVATAQPGQPVYERTANDCVTGDNAFIGDDGKRFWDVDAGCDVYQIDVYERPTVKEYRRRGPSGRFASNEYFEYLDITSASVGVTSRYLHVRIDLFGRHNCTSGGDNITVGMMERYGFRISTDPDGRNGVLIVADQPEVKNEPNTSFGPLGIFGYRDTNGDVGGAARNGPTGLAVTKTDNANEESGMNGFDRVIISDGRLEGGPRVAWVRLDPRDNTVVELAVDYVALGFTESQIRTLAYFDVEAIKGGPKDPQNYLWNDKYTNVEAGSPNPGRGGASEFGTEGLENIYEVDTVRVDWAGGPPPSCQADFDRNGTVNTADFFGFIAAFFAGEPRADIDGDGTLGSNDFFTFFTIWFAGCP